MKKGQKIDDVSKGQKQNLCPNKDIAHQDLSAITKLPWSKNVTTKKQAPWQILIGAANSHYCVLLGLAVGLEFMIIYDRYDDSDFLFAYRGSNDEDAIRKKASEILKSILTDDESQVLLDELKGTHSMRKFATDMAKKRGIHKDDIDLRFRWMQKRMQNNYASTTIPSIDGTVAGALCKDGPIYYHL